MCVVNAAQTDDVLFGASGIAKNLSVGHTVMLCPTIAPQDVERFAARFAERGIACIDAPMSGGPARAANGSMSLMVACCDAVFAQHSQLINDLSTKVFRTGERPGRRLCAPRPHGPVGQRHRPCRGRRPCSRFFTYARCCGR